MNDEKLLEAGLNKCEYYELNMGIIRKILTFCICLDALRAVLLL